MKKLILPTVVLLALGIIAFTVIPNKEEIPKAVLESFAGQFPEASHAEWEKESTDEYEVDFKINRVEMSATYDLLGNWLEVETEVNEEDLPTAIADVINKSFGEYEIESIEKLSLPDLDDRYEVSFENEDRDEEIEVLFSANGTIIKQTNVDEDE